VQNVCVTRTSHYIITDRLLFLLHSEYIFIFFYFLFIYLLFFLLGENNDDTAGLAPSAVIPGLYFYLVLFRFVFNVIICHFSWHRLPLKIFWLCSQSSGSISLLVFHLQNTQQDRGIASSQPGRQHAHQRQRHAIRRCQDIR